jgi:hypothetical protein
MMLALVVVASSCGRSGGGAPATGGGAGNGNGIGGATAGQAGAGGDASSAPTGGSDGGVGAGGAPFEPVAVTSYVAKVKNLLVGLPPTDAEVQSVEQDPTALGGLVSAWMQQPEYGDKMRQFFELAFQQTQISAADFADQAYPKQIAINPTLTPLLIQNARESFARTMIALVAADQPLTAGVTTRQFMMTTALKEMYAFLDVWQVDDTGKVTDGFKRANPSLTITAESAAGAIPLADTLNPASPSYMHWYDPDVATAGAAVAGCTEDPIVFPPSAATLHYLLYGSLDGRKNAAGTACPPTAGSATAPQLTAADFSDWQMVTIRQPAAGEAVTPFYDLAQLRTTAQLVLAIPRVGFFSTPAFFANWPTNISNQMRVTLNQALIVALGGQIDGSDAMGLTGAPLPGFDPVHSADAACAVCHRALDPMRSIFAQTYSWNYHTQADPSLTAIEGTFAFEGVTQPVASMADFGTALAMHPKFAEAWVQRLCYYANSAACSATDPEFQRIVTLFRGANHSWSTLVAALFTSPLVTNATPTLTAATNGEVIAVSRRGHLCAALDNRLGLDDVCGLDAVTKKQIAATVPQIALGLPSDGYSRGSTVPVLPNQPSLFYRAATENICATLAAQVIDVPAAKQVVGVKAWSSAQPAAAIADFVALVMGLVPSDPRAAPAAAELTSHFGAAKATGATASAALQSTFVAACISPSAISIGL